MDSEKLNDTFAYLRHWRAFLRNQDYRNADNQAKAEFARFRDQEGGAALRHDLRPAFETEKVALVASLDQVPLAKLEGVLTKAFQAAGFKTVILSNGQFDLRRYYRLAGVKNVVTWANFRTRTDADWVVQQLARLGGLHDWLALKYRGVHVGRFAVASTMRNMRQGQLDFANSTIAAELRRCLEASVGFTLAGEQIFAEVKPDCVLLLDRGYVGQGELFDLAVDRKIDALTWNGGYRSNLIFLKRYNVGNERDHHASLSAESWAHMQSVPWKEEYGQCVRNELFRCYETQDWFSFVGTQFGKTILPSDAARQALGLEPGKKVAVIFPHILWDGSFFWGEDLFDDYTQWFAETIRVACANPRLE